MRIPTDFELAREFRAMLFIGALMLVVVIGLVVYAGYRDNKAEEARWEIISDREPAGRNYQ